MVYLLSCHCVGLREATRLNKECARRTKSVSLKLSKGWIELLIFNLFLLQNSYNLYTNRSCMLKILTTGKIFNSMLGAKFNAFLRFRSCRVFYFPYVIDCLNHPCEYKSPCLPGCISHFNCQWASRPAEKAIVLSTADLDLLYSGISHRRFLHAQEWHF